MVEIDFGIGLQTDINHVYVMVAMKDGGIQNMEVYDWKDKAISAAREQAEDMAGELIEVNENLDDGMKEDNWVYHADCGLEDEYVYVQYQEIL